MTQLNGSIRATLVESRQKNASNSGERRIALFSNRLGRFEQRVAAVDCVFRFDNRHVIWLSRRGSRWALDNRLADPEWNNPLSRSMSMHHLDSTSIVGSGHADFVHSSISREPQQLGGPGTVGLVLDMALDISQS